MIAAILLLLFSALVAEAQATFGRPAILRDIGIEQKMGAQVPVDLGFTDEAGQPVKLRGYLGKPVILALVYYRCPSLCNMVLDGVLRSVKGLKMTAGNEYDVLAVSFDPRETPALAAAKKESYVKSYGRVRSEAGWHFLTGPESSSKSLADAIGFRYTFDKASNQYAHASAIIILTPEGRVARYFYGIDYPARDVRLGLVEASNNRIGSPVDQVLLFCFHYDASTGKYGLMIVNILRAAGVLTAGALATFMIVMFRRDYRDEVKS
jgi:protein SCO1/2